MVSSAYNVQAASREPFIAGMRNVACSVGVVTTTGAAGRHGATVNAFSSVSADPPQLLVCLRSESRIAAAVSTNQSFCLNVLSSRHSHVADRFSGRHDAALNDRFEGIDFHQDGAEWVVLRDANAFGCQVSEMLQTGSHTIFLGRVKAVQTSGGEPLTYLQGSYRQLASP